MLKKVRGIAHKLVTAAEVLLPTGEEKSINRLKEVRQMIIVLIMVIGLVFSIIVPLLLLKKAGVVGGSVSGEFERNIAILHLDEPITVPYINRVMERLEEVKKKTIEGSFNHLIIVASSPGGSPQGSDELANYLKSFQKIVPTTLYVQNVCASGCYYIAAAIQKEEDNPLSGIISNANAIVGSIGVVLPHFVYGPALEKFGMQNEYIVEGEHKVPIDSWSLATEESKKYIKANLLAPVYKTFQDFVKTHRGLSDEKMETLNGGRVFISTLVVGTLVDRISHYQEIREEVKAKVEKQFPEDEVGFVVINTKAQAGSFFSTMFNIENVTIEADTSGFNPTAINKLQLH